MKILEYVNRARLDASAEEVFQWLGRPGAFERLNPPWQPFRGLTRTGSIETGGEATVLIPLGMFHLRWTLEHRDFLEGRQFREVQLKGPFAHWSHLTSAEPDGPDACYLDNRVAYSLPLGLAGRAMVGGLVLRRMEEAFRYRNNTLDQDLKAHRRYAPMPRYKVAISGASGTIGSNLAHYLTTAGHQVKRLVRTTSARQGPVGDSSVIPWDPARGVLDGADLEGLDALVHLSGETIMGRWTPAKKQRMRDSRVGTARLLADTLSRLRQLPKVFLSASAVGIYGSARGDAVMDEDSPAGEGFLGELAREWEEASEAAASAGIRVVHLRLGPVVTPMGGMLKTMLPPFKAGVGGPVGSGRQYVSWVSLDDTLGAVEHCMMTHELEGPVNITAPEPATNGELTRALGKTLGRPTLLKVPGTALKAALGKMADESLLGSTRAVPRKLLDSGYAFRHPDIETALKHVLGRG